MSLIDPCCDKNEYHLNPSHEGEVLERSPQLFFISFRGKQYGSFASRVGAEEFLKVLQTASSD